MSQAAKSSANRPFQLKWHRRLSLVLLVQLGVWLLTALCMALIPAEKLTAYQDISLPDYDASADWPAAQELSRAAPQAHSVTLEEYRAGPSLVAHASDAERGTHFAPGDLAPKAALTADEARAIAGTIAGEDLSQADASLVEEFSYEYTFGGENPNKVLPVWRVEADKAILFINPANGELASQSTFAQQLEAIAKSLHAMDYTLSVSYRDGTLISIFTAIFLATAILGVLPVRQVYALKRKGWKSIRWHQAIGLVLFIQIVFWATSGLSVVWVLHRYNTQAEDVNTAPSQAIDWSRVAVSPAEIVGAEERKPSQITLTTVLGEPVYQLTWKTPEKRKSFFAAIDRQALFSAVDGRAIELGKTDIEQIARQNLPTEMAATLGSFEQIERPNDYFFTGPYPAFQAQFSAPTRGAVTIDPITGSIHSPVRFDNQALISEYYKLHVVQFFPGFLKYRFEPALLAVIGFSLLFLIAGVMIHLRRLRMKRKT